MPSIILCICYLKTGKTSKACRFSYWTIYAFHRGFQRGQRPLGTRLCLQSLVCYTFTKGSAQQDWMRDTVVPVRNKMPGLRKAAYIEPSWSEGIGFDFSWIYDMLSSTIWIMDLAWQSEGRASHPAPSLAEGGGPHELLWGNYGDSYNCNIDCSYTGS